MEFDEIVKIFIFLLGTVLQISTLFLMARRKGNKKREIVFALFTFSVLSWSFGIFMSLFCGYLYRGINAVEQSLGTIAIFSFPLIFPLLVHTLLSFMEQKYYLMFPPLKYAIIIILYLPTLLFIRPLAQFLQNPFPILDRLENFIVYDSLFLLWQFVLLTAAWYMIIRMCRDIEAHKERRFLGLVGWWITLLISLYFLTFVLQGSHWYGFGPYLVLLTEAATFFLPPLLAYFLYYYSYMEYIFKRGLLYCILGIFVIACYLYIVRPIGEGWEKRFRINFRMIEGIMVMAMVFFFNPFKRLLHELTNRIFFTERQYYRKIFSELSVSIGRSSYMELESLLASIAATISRAMKIREVSFIFFERPNGTLHLKESTILVTPRDIENIVDYLSKQNLQVLNIYNLGENDTEILRELKKLKAFTIIAIYNEQTLIGMLNLGRRLIRHQLLAEEEEMLLMLLNQLVTEIENTQLAREKFAMERKMYESEKLSSLGRLSASIAHEVKNPLSSIKTIAQVMREERAPDDSDQEGLNLIIEEVDRLTRVVKQLLLFARPHRSNLEKITVAEALQNVLLLLRHEADCNQVRIHNQVPADLVLTLERDAISEIFFNLVHNSIQAMPQGGDVTISSQIEVNEEKGDRWVRLRVADTGPGIPPTDREKIFEPFYTTKQTGTGLGLTIVRDKVEKLQGKVAVADNRPGAVFDIYLPLDTTEDRPETTNITQSAT